MATVNGKGEVYSMGLANRKKLKALCNKYGLACNENRDLRETVIYKDDNQYPERVGVVTFYELRDPDWENLEDLVLSLSMFTGAWLE